MALQHSHEKPVTPGLRWTLWDSSASQSSPLVSSKFNERPCLKIRWSMVEVPTDLCPHRDSHVSVHTYGHAYTCAHPQKRKHGRKKARKDE